MWCIFFWAGMNFCSGTSPDESNINNYNLNYYAIGGYFISLKLSWGQDFLKGKKSEYRSVTAKVARKSHVTPRREWGQRQEGGPGRTPKPPAKWREPRKGDAAETKEQRVGGVGGGVSNSCHWRKMFMKESNGAAVDGSAICRKGGPISDTKKWPRVPWRTQTSGELEGSFLMFMSKR